MTAKPIASISDALRENWRLVTVFSVLSVVVCYFNYDTRAIGLYKYYECYRALFSAGFDLAAHTCDSNTFPI